MVDAIIDAIQTHIQFIRENPTIDFNNYIYSQKHKRGAPQTDPVVISARILEHMGFMSDADRTADNYRIIDMFRKIPRNLSPKYYNLFIDNYHGVAAKHGTVIKNPLVEMFGKKEYNEIIKQLNNVSSEILSIEHVRKKLIKAIVGTDTRSREMPRVCSLFNYIEAITNSPKIDSYRFITYDITTKSYTGNLVSTDETTIILDDVFGSFNDNVVEFLFELAVEISKKDTIKKRCAPLLTVTSSLVATAAYTTVKANGGAGTKI